MHKSYKRIIKSRYLNAKPSTIKEMSIFVEGLPNPSNITKEWILDFLTKFSNPYTRFSNFTRLRIILKELDKEQLISDIKIKVPKPNLTRASLLTSNQVSSLLRASKNPMQRGLFELLLESGCRIGEVLNLTKNDVRIQTDFVLITFNGKTGVREVPLMKSNLTTFLYHYATTENERLFSYKYNTIREQINRVYKKAGVPRPKRPFHIFRHMKATYLMEMSVPEHLIKKFLGWSNSSDMINRYTHLSSRNIQDYFGRLYGIDVKPVEPLYPEEEREKLKQIFG